VWTALWPATAVVVLALALTAFFWLPAYAELDFTQSRRADSPFANWPRYEQHFVAWGDMAGWPPEPGDPALTNPPLVMTVGVGTAVLALFGYAANFFQRKSRPDLWRWAWLWGLITAVALFLASPASAWLWGNLPLPEFVQLPFRFLGPASLGMAVLAGAVLERLETGDWRLRRISNLQSPISNLLFLAAVLLVAMSGWFWLYPVVCAVPAATVGTAAMTPTAVAEATVWDEAGHVQQWGGDSLGETLPRWVDTLPPANDLLHNSQFTIHNSPFSSRLDLPDTAVLLTHQSHPTGDDYRLQLTVPVTLTYRTFYAPYWRATLNSAPVALSPRPGDGLIQLAAPAGEVELAFHFGLTSLRQATLLLSGAALVGLFWWGRRRDVVAALSIPSRGLWLRLILALAVLGLAWALVNGTNNPIHAARLLTDGRLARVSYPAQLSFGGEFLYLGYNGPAEMAADETAVFTHYWRAQRPIGVPYAFQLRLADDAGRVWNRPTVRPASFADLPGKPGWRVDGYARDAYEMTLLPGTPPGLYWLEISAFRTDTDLSLVPTGAPTAANPALARVGQVRVTPGDWRLTADNAAVAHFPRTPIAAQPGLTLLGWTLPARPWRPGDVAELDLLWQSEVVGERPLPITLDLYDDAGMVVAQQAVMPGEAGIGRDKVQWRLPAELVTGHYVVNLTAGEQTFALGEWQIDAPEHRFAAPDVAQTAVFTVPFASLVGVNGWDTAVAPGETLEVELVWLALATADASYRVFVHLVDGAGALIAQSDAIPDHWTRPTTGWLPGEYIRDRHTLTLPPEAPPAPYTLRLGWYDPTTGQRVGEWETRR
jgi:hypothetical protein